MAAAEADRSYGDGNGLHQRDCDLLDAMHMSVAHPAGKLWRMTRLMYNRSFAAYEDDDAVGAAVYSFAAVERVHTSHGYYQPPADAPESVRRLWQLVNARDAPLLWADVAWNGPQRAVLETAMDDLVVYMMAGGKGAAAQRKQQLLHCNEQKRLWQRNLGPLDCVLTVWYGVPRPRPPLDRAVFLTTAQRACEDPRFDYPEIRRDLGTDEKREQLWAWLQDVLWSVDNTTPGTRTWHRWLNKPEVLKHLVNRGLYRPRRLADGAGAPAGAN